MEFQPAFVGSEILRHHPIHHALMTVWEQSQRRGPALRPATPNEVVCNALEFGVLSAQADSFRAYTSPDPSSSPQACSRSIMASAVTQSSSTHANDSAMTVRKR